MILTTLVFSPRLAHIWGAVLLGVVLAGAVVWVVRKQMSKRRAGPKPDKTYYGRRPDYAHFSEHQRAA
jgi:hypothetical protein